MDLHNIEDAFANVRGLLQAAVLNPFHLVRLVLVLSAAYLLALIRESMSYTHMPLDVIDDANKDRLIDSFTDEECYSNFRFTRQQMHYLVLNLRIEETYTCDNGNTFPGEHGLCLYLYTRTFPVKLQRLQNVFGREYSQLSRIACDMKYWLYNRHSGKV